MLVVAIVSAVLLSPLLQGAARARSAGDDLGGFAREIEASLAKGDKTVFVSAFDTDALNERALSGLPAKDSDRQRHAKVPEQLAASIGAAIQQGASYRFLRVRTLDGAERALFRLVHKNGSFNYNELLLTRRGGRVRVDDVYVALSGEWISQSLRRAWQLGEAIGNPGILARLTGADRELLKSAALIKEYGDLLAAGKRAEALAAYAKMPTVAQDSKNMLVGAITCAQADEKAYARLVERFGKLFPNDPALDIMQIDYYFNRGDHARTLQCLARLDRTLGGDAYLRTLTATVEGLMGNAAAARRSLEAAIAMEPGLQNPYWPLIEMQLAARDWAGTVATFAAIERDAGVKLGDLKNAAVYAEFVKTREYRDWMKRRQR